MSSRIEELEAEVKMTCRTGWHFVTSQDDTQPQTPCACRELRFARMEEALKRIGFFCMVTNKEAEHLLDRCRSIVKEALDGK